MAVEIVGSDFTWSHNMKHSEIVVRLFGPLRHYNVESSSSCFQPGEGPSPWLWNIREGSFEALASSGQPPEDGHFAGIRPLQFALYSTLHQLRSNVRNDGNGTGPGQIYLTPLQLEIGSIVNCDKFFSDTQKHKYLL